MKIYLAGTFGEQKHAEQMTKSKYVLESFFYFKPWQKVLLKTCDSFMLDSGAYTFMQSKKNHTDWNKYVHEYADFINEHKIDLFFELDIDSVIGYEKVLKLRNQLERLTGKQSIPVWHISRGKEEFIKMCEEYPYVAIGGIVSREIKPTQYPAFTWFIKEAHKHNARVHGLGFTKVGDLSKYHFDSVDSTRWKCERFGRIEYFDGKTMKPLDMRKNNKRIANTEKAMLYTHNEWCKFQQYADIHY